MAPDEKLSQVLGEFLQRELRSTHELALLTKPSPSAPPAVPQRTIANWLYGQIKRPRRWQDVVVLALALRSDLTQTDRLLRAAQHKTVHQLLGEVTEASDRDLLMAFSTTRYAPFQAIADLHTFVGRQTEIAEISSILKGSGRVTVLSLKGMGGIGKTTLAAHIATQLKDEFTDGVLWARLDVSDTMSVLHSFAAAYQMDVTAYKDVDSRSTAVRNLLNQKRALLVLDNAEKGEQVKPLLPSSISQCAVLVTTRNDLSATDGWHIKVLQDFRTSPADALALFEQYLGTASIQAHQATFTRICEQLGHLPLALAIVAGKLAFIGRAASPAILADEIVQTENALIAETGRLSPLQRDDLNVHASFNISYEALSVDMQAFFIALSVFEGEDFSIKAAAHVAECAIEIAQARLEELRMRSLVSANRDNRYRVHILLRQFAQSQFAESGQSNMLVATYHRMIDFYLAVIAANQNGNSHLGVEISNIWAALLAVMKQQWLLDAADKVHTLVRFLIERDSTPQVQPFLQTAIQISQHAGDDHGQAKLLNLLGYTQWWRGQDSSESHESALALALRVDNIELACNALRRLGYLSSIRNDQIAAINQYERGLQLARSHMLRREVILLLINLSHVYMRLQDLVAADQCLTECVSMVTEEDGATHQVAALQAMGSLRVAQNRLDIADELYIECIAIAHNNQRDDLLMGALGDRAEGLLKQGRSKAATAMQCARDSREICERLGFRRGVCDGWCRMGQAALLQKDRKTAQACFAQAIDIAQSHGYADVMEHINRLT